MQKKGRLFGVLVRGLPVNNISPSVGDDLHGATDPCFAT